ncbi:MAG: YfiM family protein [Saprospiraceae bacterium]|nr:YfiM family protein [Saprospiraceae bacterium]
MLRYLSSISTSDDHKGYPTSRRDGLLLSFTLILLFCSCSQQRGVSQSPSFFSPADTFQTQRFWTSVGIGATAYGIALVGLNTAWYADSEPTRFHTFDDWQEWRHMDKLGHIWTTYSETRWLTQGARWTGMDRSASRWTGLGVALALQTSVEILDAFSAKWGFSWPDMGANLLGAGIFATQDIIWKEQRILMKISSNPVPYSADPITGINGEGTSSLKARAHDLFGGTFAAQYLKDYNAMTIWMSVNPASFMAKKPAWLPSWLNVAVGISGEHLYGGYANTWTEDDGSTFQADPTTYPRMTQVFFSPDIDLSRISVRHPFWRTILHGLNFIKIPAPAFSLDSKGRWSGHWLYF